MFTCMLVVMSFGHQDLKPTELKHICPKWVYCIDGKQHYYCFYLMVPRCVISSVGNITTYNGCLFSMHITSGKMVLHSCIVMSLHSHIIYAFNRPFHHSVSVASSTCWMMQYVVGPMASMVTCPPLLFLSCEVSDSFSWHAMSDAMLLDQSLPSLQTVVPAESLQAGKVNSNQKYASIPIKIHHYPFHGGRCLT